MPHAVCNTHWAALVNVMKRPASECPACFQENVFSLFCENATVSKAQFERVEEHFFFVCCNRAPHWPPKQARILFLISRRSFEDLNGSKHRPKRAPFAGWKTQRHCLMFHLKTSGVSKVNKTLSENDCCRNEVLHMLEAALLQPHLLCAAMRPREVSRPQEWNGNQHQLLSHWCRI